MIFGKKDHPRLRGEYNFLLDGMTAITGSSPLVRGILCNVLFEISHDRITPACAGSTDVIDYAFDWQKDHPRLRGEYKVWESLPLSVVGSPPLARGVRESGTTDRPPIRITPACAGSTQRHCNYRYFVQDHPRLRGEYIARFASCARDLGSPPLARGVQVAKVCCVVPRRITPACAGSTF